MNSMKDKIQIALLSVIAVALVAIAVMYFTSTQGSTTVAGNTVAATPNVVAQAPPAADASKPAFDPLGGNTETVDLTPKTTVKFAKYEHDFGNVKQESTNKYVFTFTNTGNEPLIIESATGSCGCTVPNYPKQPIPPGGKGEIEVEYKPGKQENAQTKTVRVVANTEPKETTLTIRANVLKIEG
jgi:hypothetical protein